MSGVFCPRTEPNRDVGKGVILAPPFKRKLDLTNIVSTKTLRCKILTINDKISCLSCKTSDYQKDSYLLYRHRSIISIPWRLAVLLK